MKFMTIDNVADNLAVKRRTVERLIKSGQLYAIKVNSMVRISEESYQNFISYNAIKNTELKQETNSVPKEKENPDFSTAESLLKHCGKWKGSKDEVEDIIKYIKESRTDAEF
jgi:excisionase family DNA binding protein